MKPLACLVEFSDNINTGKDTIRFRVLFRSEKVMDAFIDTWQHVGGFRRFNYDFLYEIALYKPEYPLIPNNYRGYRIVMHNLYPELY